MKWYEDYDTFLHQFETKKEALDETAFYFKTDPQKTDHYIGYIEIAGTDTPFWTGLCDIEDGCEFSSARELLEAPIYDGRSIKDRWSEVCIYQLGGLTPSDWKYS